MTETTEGKAKLYKFHGYWYSSPGQTSMHQKQSTDAAFRFGIRLMAKTLRSREMHGACQSAMCS